MNTHHFMIRSKTTTSYETQPPSLQESRMREDPYILVAAVFQEGKQIRPERQIKKSNITLETTFCFLNYSDEY